MPASCPLSKLPLQRRTLLPLLAAAAVPPCAVAAAPDASPPGFLVRRLSRRVAAPQSWQDLQGRIWSLAALRGRAVLLNLWASWCAPCREEMPALHALQAQLGPQRLQVLLLNHREPRAKVGAFVDQQGWQLPVVVDEAGAMAQRWGVRIFPSSVLINARGQEVALLIGAVDWMAQLDAPWMRDWLGPSALGASAL